MPQFFKLEETARRCDLDINIVTEWVHNEWITPAEPDDFRFDEEDLARIRLIQELRADLGVNDESVPIILNLLDQIHHLRNIMDREMRSGR